MSGAARRPAAARALAAAALALAAACAPGDTGDAGDTGGDGGDAAGDAAALPPPLAEALALDRLLDPAAVRARPPASCRTEADPARGQLRRTVHAADADGATRLVFARAGLPDSALQRVEVVHRPAGGAQLGLSWSAADDAVRVVGYRPAGGDSGATLRYDARAAARRLRAIGERALAVTCPPGRAPG